MLMTFEGRGGYTSKRWRDYSLYILWVNTLSKLTPVLFNRDVLGECVADGQGLLQPPGGSPERPGLLIE